MENDKPALSDVGKVNILNSMDFVDSSASGGELEYVLVEYNNENISKFKQIFPNENLFEHYMHTLGDIDNEKELIEISVAAFQFAGADYYRSGSFIIYTKEEVLEMLEEEKEKSRRLEAQLQKIQDDVQILIRRIS